MKPKDVVLEPDIQPSDAQLEHDPIFYLHLEFDAKYMQDPEGWKRGVEVGPEVGPVFEAALNEALESALGKPSQSGSPLIKVERRPPMAGPLVPTFFIDLYDIVRVYGPEVAVSLVASAGYDLIKTILRTSVRATDTELHKLDIGNAHLATHASPYLLELACRDYVQRTYHRRARLTSERETYNTHIEGGYVLAIDSKQPSGWKVVVSSYNATYTFTFEGTRRLLELSIRRGGEQSVEESPSMEELLLEDVLNEE